MSLYPGAPRWDVEEEKWVLDDLALKNSMAQAMEDAMEKAYERIKGQVFPELGKDDRRLLFVAIAQGVVQHFTDNALDAFDIEVNVEQQTDTGPCIASKGDTGNPSNGYVHTHPVQIRQIDSPNNRIKSEGKGKDDVKVTILTTGELL